MSAIARSAFATAVPVEISRDAARSAARVELTDPAYHAAEPSPVARALGWVLDRITELFDAATTAVPGGPVGLLVLVALLVAVVVVVRLRVGPLARGRRGARAVFDGGPRSAADHRLAAERAFARGDLPEAVRERFRAIIRDLEQRGLLDARSGRTAAESAAEASRQLPVRAAELREAAHVFDDVVYGGRAATAEDCRRLADTDAAVRAERPSLAGAR